MRIGISGVAGSFTEAAAHIYLGGQNAELEFLTHAGAVLDAVAEGKVDVGIFAIENSNGGVVTEYLPAIAEHQFSIDKIFEVPVDHMLLVKKGTRATDVTKIVSQRQALRQCRMYLQRQWPNIEVGEYVDTATAAKDLSEGALPSSTAVVASQRAGDVYGLDVLDAKIQDLKFNYTVFIAAKKFVSK